MFPELFNKIDIHLGLEDELKTKTVELEKYKSELTEAEEMRNRELEEQEAIATEFEQMQKQVSMDR